MGHLDEIERKKEFLVREIKCDIHNIQEAKKLSDRKSGKLYRSFVANVKRVAKKHFGAHRLDPFETCLKLILQYEGGRYGAR